MSLLPLLLLPSILTSSNITISNNLEWYWGGTDIPIALTNMFTGYNPATNEIWMLGGKNSDGIDLNSIYIMDLNTKIISQSSSILQVTISANLQAYTQIDSVIYFMDSNVNDRSLHALDMTTYTTSNTAISELPSEAGFGWITIGCFASYDDKIYIPGGRKSGFPSGAYDTWIYSISTNQWSTGAQVQKNLAGHSCNVIDGVLYVIGGVDTAGIPYETGTVEYWDIRNDQQATSYGLIDPDKELNPGRGYHRSIGIGEGRILITGGMTECVASEDPRCQYSWQRTKSTDGVILLYTGHVGDEYFFDWEELSPLNWYRMYHGFVLVDDYFIVIGGYEDINYYYYTQWEYSDDLEISKLTMSEGNGKRKKDVFDDIMATNRSKTANKSELDDNLHFVFD